MLLYTVIQNIPFNGWPSSAFYEWRKMSLVIGLWRNNGPVYTASAWLRHKWPIVSTTRDTAGSRHRRRKQRKRGDDGAPRTVRAPGGTSPAYCVVAMFNEWSSKYFVLNTLIYYLQAKIVFEFPLINNFLNYLYKLYKNYHMKWKTNYEKQKHGCNTHLHLPLIKKASGK